MNIGIFGDSFGCSGKVLSTSKPWYILLKEQHEVFNTCRQGSNLFYAYESYLRNQGRQFDKVIFLVTALGRIRVHSLYHSDNWTSEIPNYDRARELLQKAQKLNDHRRIEIYQTAVNYFLYFYSLDQEKILHGLMLEKIRQIPNSLVIPCFDNSFPGQTNYSCLMDISLIDLDFYKNQLDNLGNHRFVDRRHCHMNDANNRIFAGKIMEWIDSGVWNLEINDYQNPAEPYGYYFDCPPN